MREVAIIIGVFVVLYLIFVNRYFLWKGRDPYKRSQIVNALLDERQYMRGCIVSEESKPRNQRDEREIRKLKHALATIEFKLSKLR